MDDFLLHSNPSKESRAKINSLRLNLTPLAEVPVLGPEQQLILIHAITEISLLNDTFKYDNYELISIKKELIICLVSAGLQNIPTPMFFSKKSALLFVPYLDQEEEEVRLIKKIKDNLKNKPSVTSKKLNIISHDINLFLEKNPLPQYKPIFYKGLLLKLPIINMVTRLVLKVINDYRWNAYLTKISKIPPNKKETIDKLALLLKLLPPSKGKQSDDSFDESYKSMRSSLAKRQGENTWNFGSEGGFCYGYGIAYSKHQLQNPDIKFEYGPITQAIYTAQEQQRDPIKDWNNLPSKRLISKHQQSYPSKWLTHLEAQLNKNINSQLSIHIESPKGSKHDQRISLNNKGVVRFLDSNFGAFEFKSVEAFKKFYLDILGQYKSEGTVYDMFSLHLHALKNTIEANELKPSVYGKCRSLMNGSKYGSWQGFNNITTFGRFFDSYAKKGIYADDFSSQVAKNRVSSIDEVKSESVSEIQRGG